MYNIKMEGKIYKLSSPSTDNVYIGCTTQTLPQCFWRLKSMYRQYKEGKHDYQTSHELVQYDDCVIKLIELVKGKKSIRNDREAHYIKTTPNVVNKNIPNRTKEEYESLKIQCDICKCEVHKCHKSTHNKSIKHQTNLKKQLNDMNINDASKAIFKRTYNLIQKQKSELELLEEEYEKLMS